MGSIMATEYTIMGKGFCKRGQQHIPSKNEPKLTSLGAKPTSPGLSDTTFFARCSSKVKDGLQLAL